MVLSILQHRLFEEDQSIPTVMGTNTKKSNVMKAHIQTTLNL